MYLANLLQCLVWSAVDHCYIHLEIYNKYKWKILVPWVYSVILKTDYVVDDWVYVLKFWRPKCLTKWHNQNSADPDQTAPEGTVWSGSALFAIPLSTEGRLTEGCTSDRWSGDCGFVSCRVGNILSWRLIMKYFLRSFSPFCWFKKGSCQFLTKECAKYWLTALLSLPSKSVVR